jgi:hypothetical protein
MSLTDRVAEAVIILLLGGTLLLALIGPYTHRD